MKPIQIVGVLAGAFIASPGLLWFLQGMAIIRMRPILCVADCEPIMGGSPTWAAAGAVAFIVGVGIAFFGAGRGEESLEELSTEETDPLRIVTDI